MKTLALFIFIILAIPVFGQEKTIAITMDDLPAQLGGHDSTTLIQLNQRILSYFTAWKVPAIGFVNEGKLFTKGKIISYRYEMLALWTQNHLELGNHTFTHQDYNTLEPEGFFKIIKRGELITKKLTREAGLQFRYFRHPYLHRGNTEAKVKALEEYLAKEGYQEAPVTIDNSEWIFANAYDKAYKASDEAMMNKTGEAYINYMMDKTAYYEQQCQKLFGRPIAHTLLIHANLLNSNYLDDLLQAFQEAGYRFVSLDEALKDPAYQTEDHFIGNAGISWVDRWALTKGYKGDFFKDEPRCPQFILDYTGFSE